MGNNMIKSSDVKKPRNSSIELLRIIAMMMIVTAHAISHGINSFMPLYELNPCFNKYMLESIDSGNLGVDIFIMITGYFLVKSTFRIEKLLKLVLQVFFYSMSIFIIFSASGIIDFSLTALIKSFFPALFNKYWFFTSYILIYILCPFINKYLNAENRNNHLILIVILYAVIRVAAVVIAVVNGSSFNSIGFADLLISYLIGAYLRLYPDNLLLKNKNAAILLIVSTAVEILSVAAMNIASGFIPSLAGHYSFLQGRTSLISILIAASVFAIFSKIHIKENKFINTVSSCTFGVYLIHDNPSMREFLWSTVFRVQDYVYSKALILYILLFAAVIFAACAVIDFIRQKTIEKPVIAAVSAVCGKVRQKAAILIDKKSKTE